MQYDVFISYARKDYVDGQTKEVIPGNIVSRIKQLLDDNKLTYWFDEAGIYSGDQFAGVIADAIEQSTVFLYISTAASNGSKWTINEIATAKHLDKKIIPFRYDESKYNKSILMYLAPLDHIEYPKNKDKAFGQLIASIKTYKHSLELAEQESQRAAELAKQREQEKLEKQKQELEKQLRIQEVNKQLETLYIEIQKKQQERASINIVLDGLEKQRTNLENELAFLTGKASSFEPIIEEDVVVVPGWKGTLSSIWETTKRLMRRLYRFLLATIAGIAILFGIILSLPSVRYDTPEEMYQRGNTFSQKGNIKKAIRWYRKAAEQGHAEAQVNMVFYSIQGIGVDRDTIQAVEWYQKAAEKGHAEAQYILGDFYYNGVGVTPDTIQAVEWYRKAAEQGHTSAQHMMGIAYENGYGIERSEPTAIEWYRKAAKGTGPAQEEAKNALARLYALADGEVNGHEYVDLGLSVKWATCNVGADSPEGCGDYFAWGEKSKYKREAYNYYDKTKKTCKDISGIKYDVARAKWGGNWRMPRLEEIKELINKCSWQWTELKGIEGYEVTGPNGNSVFLPAAGYRDGAGVCYRGSFGIYWSGTLYEDYSNSTYYLYFRSDFHGWYDSYYRSHGLTVRPVTE